MMIRLRQRRLITTSAALLWLFCLVAGRLAHAGAHEATDSHGPQHFCVYCHYGQTSGAVSCPVIRLAQPAESWQLVHFLAANEAHHRVHALSLAAPRAPPAFS